MNRNIYLFSLITILFTAIGIYFGNRGLQTEVHAAPAAQHLFNTALPDLNSQEQSLGQWKGKILLVNFWATWCHPCVEEMPALSALQSGGKAKNFQIIGIGIDSAANMNAFSAKYEISYPLYVAGMHGSDLMREFGDQAGGLPFSVLIAPNGQIKKTYLGRLPMDELQHDLNTL